MHTVSQKNQRMSGMEVPATPVVDTSSGAGKKILVEVINDKEDIVKYLEHILRKERDGVDQPCRDYLSKIRSIATGSDIDPVNEKWRRKLCEWCYEVTDHFKFDREAVSIALCYLDRSADHWIDNSQEIITKKEYQLLAVTSLYMALKVHGETECSLTQRRKLKIDAFCELSRNQFSVAMIEETERFILRALNWDVNPPTALKIISTFLSLCPRWESVQHLPHASVIGGIYDVARYLAELSVCQSDFTFTCKTATIAFAAILFAMDALQSTMPLPYAVRVRFLNDIAQVTGLVSGSAEVLHVYSMLKNICPDMVCTEEIIRDDPIDDNFTEVSEESSVNGKSSPVCVIAEQQEPTDNEGQRKRIRPSGENIGKPTQATVSS